MNILLWVSIVIMVLQYLVMAIDTKISGGVKILAYALTMPIFIYLILSI